MESLMEHIEATLEAIQKDIAGINSKIDKLQFINIKNGGGRHVQFLKDEFFQMLYDRPKDTFYNIGKISGNWLKILDLAGKVVVPISVLYLLLK